MRVIIIAVAIMALVAGTALATDMIILENGYLVVFNMSEESPIFADSDGDLGEFTIEGWETSPKRRVELGNDTEINSTEVRLTRREYSDYHYVKEEMVLWLSIFELPDEAAVTNWLDYHQAHLELVRTVDRGVGELPAVVGLNNDRYHVHWQVGNQTIAWLSYVPCERGRSSSAADMMAFDDWIYITRLAMD